VQPQRERDFRHLQDLIGDLQRRIRSLEGNLQDSQKDYEEALGQ
jgi:predicted  nucleic acid-binding Zn-ribbon protein